MRVMVAIVAVALAASAACGGNGGAKSQSTASKRAIEAQAQQRAQSIVLKLADFPNGWRALRHDVNAAGEHEFSKCLGMDNSARTIIGDANSPDFSNAVAAGVLSGATVFKSERQAKDVVEEFSRGMSGAVEGCFRDLIGQSLAEEKRNTFDIGKVDVGKLA